MIGRKKNTFILFVIFISFVFSQLVCRRLMVAQQIYKVAVLPEYLAIEMWQRLQPLMTYLEDTSGVRFELIMPRCSGRLADMKVALTTDIRLEAAWMKMNPQVQKSEVLNVE